MRKYFETHKSILKKAGCLALAVMIAGTGMFVYRNSSVSDIPELVTFVDPETVQVQEEEVPLASGTKTTRKVSTRTTTKKIKMPSKAKKTSTTTTRTTNNSTKTVSKNIQRIKTNTKVDTTIKTKTKKNSKVKTTQTKVVTTVTTTTTTVAKTTSAQTAADSKEKKTTLNVRSAASAADGRVLKAFETMGFQVVVDSSVSYSGCFDARKRTITLRRLDSTIYHELGHFVEFVGGNAAVKNSIAKAYQSEKSKYTASNKAYVLQNSSEYFAESFKNYCENPKALQKTRPNTYDAIVQALSVMTDSRVNALKNVYAAVWK